MLASQARDGGPIPLARSPVMLKESDFVKIQVAVPVAKADKVRQALGEAGAWSAIDAAIDVDGVVVNAAARTVMVGHRIVAEPHRYLVFELPSRIHPPRRTHGG